MMLVITPRTFFVGGSSGGGNVLGGKGIIAGASSRSTSIVGVGSRPWLQKVAALTVAISLTIATSDTFKVAERQYNAGLMDARTMREEVAGGMEIRIVRVISDIFLWLAQIQTLIRLFPRHKEKVLIKWIGFALVVFDTVFSCLNSFMFEETDRPREFENAIPALSYLFQLSLELLFGAWVLFYVATKRRYALYHPKMKNICVVALLSIVAITTPVVFFVTDIAQPDVDGWGDYFRWVGAAAASVLVWEWVERIEALEREEKKDGILGREIFDGDEMLDATPSAEVNWPREGSNDSGDDTLGRELKTPKPYASSMRGHGLTNIAQRIAGSRTHQQRMPLDRLQQPFSSSSDRPLILSEQGNAHDTRPAPEVAPPPSSTDTTSAASTEYAVHYHSVRSSSPAVRQNNATTLENSRDDSKIAIQNGHGNGPSTDNANKAINKSTIRRGTNLRWQAIANQFKRRRDTPPLEIRKAMEHDSSRPAQTQPDDGPSRWHVMSKLASLAADSTERWRGKTGKREEDVELPVTIIPAQPRGRTWSPGTLQLDDSPSESSPISNTDDLPVEGRIISQRSKENLLSSTQPGVGSTSSGIPPISAEETATEQEAKAFHVALNPPIDSDAPGGVVADDNQTVRAHITSDGPDVRQTPVSTESRH